MAVTWKWNHKCGELTTKSGSKINIYTGGNCTAVFLYEFKEDGQDMHSLWYFWSDKDHFRRLIKDKECVDDINRTFKSIKVNTYYKGFTDMVIECLAKTELKKAIMYYKEPKEVKKNGK